MWTVLFAGGWIVGTIVGTFLAYSVDEFIKRRKYKKKGKK